MGGTSTACMTCEAHAEMLSVESPVVHAYSKVVPDDVWAQRKLEQFAALGVR